MCEEVLPEPAAVEQISNAYPASDPVRQFRVRFFDQDGRALGRVPVVAADADAAGIAAVLRDACSDVCAWAELWSGAAPVAYATEFTGHPMRNEMSVKAQQIVVDREIVLRDSRTRIAESRRLLAELQHWSGDESNASTSA